MVQYHGVVSFRVPYHVVAEKNISVRRNDKSRTPAYFCSFFAAFHFGENQFLAAEWHQIKTFHFGQVFGNDNSDDSRTGLFSHSNNGGFFQHMPKFYHKTSLSTTKKCDNLTLLKIKISGLPS